MAGSFIRIEIDDRAVQAAFTRLLERGQDIRPALQEIGSYLELAHDERFDARQAPDGSPWDAVSIGYAERKAAGQAGSKGRRGNREPDRVLELTGDLRRTLRWQINGNELEFGSDREYAAAHQFGRPEINLPERPFLGLSDADNEAILDILGQHLEGSL